VCRQERSRHKSVLGPKAPPFAKPRGNALGNGVDLPYLSAQRVNRSSKHWPVGPTILVRLGQFLQGVALAWMNCRTFGPNRLLANVPLPENLATRAARAACHPVEEGVG
jgi:hypothetical protein